MTRPARRAPLAALAGVTLLGLLVTGCRTPSAAADADGASARAAAAEAPDATSATETADAVAVEAAPPAPPFTPRYWRVHVEETLPGQIEPFQHAMQAIVRAQREAGIPGELAWWYDLATDDGRFVNFSPVPDAAALDRAEADAELARRLGEAHRPRQDALHRTLKAHQTHVLRALPELDVVPEAMAAADAAHEPPGHVQVWVEWPRVDMQGEYLERAQRMRDVLQVMGYPLRVRAFGGVYGDWPYVYVHEAPDLATFRRTGPAVTVLVKALGEEAASEMSQAQDACLTKRVVFEADFRDDLSALPEGAPGWLWH